MGTTTTRDDAAGTTTRVERPRRSPRLAVALVPLLGLGLLGAECDPDDDDAGDDATGACEEYGESPYTAHPSWYVWPDMAPESIPVQEPQPDRYWIYLGYYVFGWLPGEGGETLRCWYRWRMEVISRSQAAAIASDLPSLPYDAGEPLAQLHDATFEALTATEESEGCAAEAPAFESVLNDLGRISILIAPDYDPSVPNADGTTAGDRTAPIEAETGLEPAFGVWWWDEESGADPVPMGTFFAEPGTWNPDFSLSEPGNATDQPTQYFSLYSWLDASGNLIPEDACPFGCPKRKPTGPATRSRRSGRIRPATTTPPVTTT